MTPCLEAQKTPSQTAFVPSMGISQDRRTGGFRFYSVALSPRPKSGWFTWNVSPNRTVADAHVGMGSSVAGGCFATFRSTKATQRMPRKTRHTKSVPNPPPDIRGFLVEVGEVVREILESRRSPSIMPVDTNPGEDEDESSGILPS